MSFSSFYQNWKEVTGAIDPQPITRTGNIASVLVDVIIGRPQWSTQVTHIKIPSGKQIPLANSHDVVNTALDKFHCSIKKSFVNLPHFLINSGNAFDADEISKIELTFRGLYFDGNKINAKFLYDSNINDENNNRETMRRLNNVVRNCEFFILGELVIDEISEKITEMEIESFNYVNRSRVDVNQELYSIK